MRSKVSLDSSREVAQVLWSYFYKLSLFSTSNYWIKFVLFVLLIKPNRANVMSILLYYNFFQHILTFFKKISLALHGCSDIDDMSFQDLL